ncbi:MAG: hypothetical protein M3R57_07540 [Chloroflexota bacterium]|nr:hypothetical protein [Chloroflexota bacterium]
MSADFAGGERKVALTLFTDAYVIRGHVQTRQRRVSDILNRAEHDFLVLVDVVLDEYGARSGAVRSDYAQINLGSVLFAVGDASDAGPVPEMHTPKIPEQALISIPPFKIIGRIHLTPERDLRDALAELTGRFVPVTDAAYWSDIVSEARTSAAMIAINHSRAQILAPHRDVDPWAGLDRSAAGGAAAAAAAAGETAGSGRRRSQTPADTGVPDPWGFGRAAGGNAPPEPNPWGPGVAQDPWGNGPAAPPAPADRKKR